MIGCSGIKGRAGKDARKGVCGEQQLYHLHDSSGVLHLDIADTGHVCFAQHLHKSTHTRCPRLEGDATRLRRCVITCLRRPLCDHVFEGLERHTQGCKQAPLCDHVFAKASKGIHTGCKQVPLRIIVNCAAAEWACSIAVRA